jgi:hypothetical protein
VTEPPTTASAPRARQSAALMVLRSSSGSGASLARNSPLRCRSARTMADKDVPALSSSRKLADHDGHLGGADARDLDPELRRCGAGEGGAQGADELSA